MTVKHTKSTQDDETEFISITNTDIYNKLISLEQKINDTHTKNEKDHNDIIIQTTKTNGKVMKSTIIATTSLTLVLLLIGLLLSHVVK